jgi:hypothetical protein
MTNAENGEGHRQQTIRQMRVQETGTAGFWKIPCSRVPVGRVGAARRAAATGHSEPFNECRYRLMKKFASRKWQNDKARRTKAEGSPKAQLAKAFGVK